MNRQIYALALLAFASPAIAAELHHEIAAQTGIEAWHWEGQGMAITLRQRLPDQSRAYFQARGFTVDQAERIALSCVFQTEIRNTAGESPVTIALSEWRVTDSGKAPKPPLSESHWAPQWEAMGVKTSARIAFRWSLFPAEQRFEPGDWNMGMITMGLPPGTPFDLEVIWHRKGATARARFPALRCAGDRRL